MIYASAYLVYSKEDLFIVQWTARELERRGIIIWNDPHDANPLADITGAVKEAVEKQAAVVVFISQAAMSAKGSALANDWGESRRIIPIYLAGPNPAEVAAVSSLQMLNEWLHPYGDKVKGNLVNSAYNPNNVSRAQEIADHVAEKIYRLLKIREKGDVVLYLGQRGEGILRGEPLDIHDDIAASSIPALVFNIGNRLRSQDETIYGHHWQELQSVLERSFAESLGGVRWAQTKNIYILGVSQLGIPFFTGRYFNRSTSATLYCLDKGGQFFTNRDQPRHKPLDGGNPNCIAGHPDIKPIPGDAGIKTISLLLFSGEKYAVDAYRYLKERTGDRQPPAVWVRHDNFKDDTAVTSYISDIIALLMDLKKQHAGLSTILLFCGLPFSVTPLLAAQLLHVVDNVVFMEYRKDLVGKGAAAGDMYVPLRTWKEEIEKIPEVKPLLYRPKTRIQFLAANPSRTSPLKLGDEMKKIQTNLKTAREGDSLELKQEWAVTMETIMQALLDNSPDIVHFSGHGFKGGIIIQDDGGVEKILSGEDLGCLFKEFKDKIKCVILNACYSEPQARAIKEHIPYVIGMKTSIPDPAAVAFSTGFYQALGAGKSIPAAFNFGLAALKVEVKSGADADIAVLL
ncbi:MAG: CHAT domain-containing protein [Candidatus Aminicenantes bacterium]|nr:CHAT domain-containing protein [Candidatus Aminicenantes bacterium]